jgi:hypothetical protein
MIVEALQPTLTAVEEDLMTEVLLCFDSLFAKPPNRAVA